MARKNRELMHELGIVFHIIRSVEEVGQANQVRRISAVALELGEVSGVVEEYLQDCWKWAVGRSEMLNGAKLKVHTIPARTVCEACGKVYPTVHYGKQCPACGSGETHLVQGNEMMIQEIEILQENEERAENDTPASGES